MPKQYIRSAERQANAEKSEKDDGKSPNAKTKNLFSTIEQCQCTRRGHVHPITTCNLRVHTQLRFTNEAYVSKPQKFLNRWCRWIEIEADKERVRGSGKMNLQNKGRLVMRFSQAPKQCTLDEIRFQKFFIVWAKRGFLFKLNFLRLVYH